jgi:hypothetical protein
MTPLRGATNRDADTACIAAIGTIRRHSPSTYSRDVV